MLNNEEQRLNIVNILITSNDHLKHNIMLKVKNTQRGFFSPSTFSSNVLTTVVSKTNSYEIIGSL